MQHNYPEPMLKLTHKQAISESEGLWKGSGLGMTTPWLRALRRRPRGRDLGGGHIRGERGSCGTQTLRLAHEGALIGVRRGRSTRCVD